MILVVCMVLTLSVVAGAVNVSDYEPDRDKEYTITWVGYQMAPFSEEPKITGFLEEKYNVDIELINISDMKRYTELINLKLATGTIPDRFWVKGIKNLEKYKNQGLLTGIPIEVVKEYAPSMYKYLNKQPGQLEQAIFDGKLYAVPSEYVPTRFPLAWRVDWLKTVGIDEIPETLDEAVTAWYKFATEDPDQNGVMGDTYGLSTQGIRAIQQAYGTGRVNFLSERAGGIWLEEDGKLIYNGVHPQMKEVLKLLRQMYEDGVLDPEFITGENQGGYWALSHSFINERIGFTTKGNWYHWYFEPDKGNTINLLKEKNPEAIVKQGLPLIGPSGKRIDEEPNVQVKAFQGFGRYLGEDKREIGKMLKLHDAMYSSFENFKEFRYGPADKNWEEEKSVEWLSSNGGHVVMAHYSPLEFERKLMNPGQAAWLEGKDFYKYHIRNEVIEPLPSEPRYKTELDKILSEAFVRIVTGKEPLDHFDEFVEKWMKAGGEQLTKEANEIYQSKN